MSETWVPKPPKGWVWTSIEDILTTLESGGRPKGGVKNITGGVPSIGGEHLLYNGGFDFKNIRYIPMEFYAKMTRGKLLKNDILVVKDGATTGKTSFISESFPFHEASINEHVYILRVYEQYIVPKYLFFWLQSPFGQQCVHDNFQGTAQGGITSSFVKNSNFPLPPFTEQQRIVNKIEELFSKLERGFIDLTNVKAQLKRYRQAVLKYAYQKLDYNTTTGEVLNVINNGYTPKANKMTQNSGEIPFIKVYNLTFEGNLDFKKNPTFIDKETHQTKLKRSIVYPNDILINIVGPPLGKVSLVPDTYPEWNINQAIVLLRPNNKVLHKYLCYFMQAPQTIQWLQKTSKATAGQYNVKVSTCREIPFPLLTIAQQDDIISQIEAKLNIICELDSIISNNINQSDRLRLSILKNAFEGKLILQDPTDEPAEKLLERIKVEIGNKIENNPTMGG